MAWATFKGFIARYSDKTPLIGGLRHTRWSDHWHASGQLIFTIFFALLPSILFGFYDYVLAGNMQQSWLAINKTISHGELFMVSASLLGPISYLALFDSKKLDPFPNRSSIIFTSIAILIFTSVGYIAVNKASQNIVPNVSINMSVVMLLLTIFLVYLISVYQNSRMPNMTEQIFREQQEVDVNSYVQHWMDESSNPNISFGRN